MAITTLRELRMHPGRVWLSMTATALRYGFVFVSMAFNAKNIVVLGLGCHQLCEGGFMASRTEFIRSCIRICNLGRLVSNVTGRTVILNHLRSVWLMALSAIGDNTMFLSVAEITREFAVLAWMSNQLIVLLGMTGQTFSLELSSKDNIEGLMRIAVATQAVVQCEMLAPFVALTAIRNVFRTYRTMARVTVNTVNLFFVSRSGHFNVSWLNFMAFDTVLNR